MTRGLITVKDLKDILEELEDDDVIILSKDSDGNNYTPLSEGITLGYYLEESSWSGDFVSDDDIKEDSDINVHDAPRAVLFWPVN